MPLSRNARITGFTSFPIRTKSPVIAALPAPVGWKLIAVATPMDGGTATPSVVIFSARGTPTWYTPPFTLPWYPRIGPICAVSMPKLPAGAAAEGAPNGVAVRARALWSAVASLAGAPRPAMCMYITRGDSCRRWLWSAVCSIPTS